MEVGAWLKWYASRVERELSLFFDAKLRKASLIDPSSVEVIKLLRDYTLRGGKRIRAALLYQGYNAFDDSVSRELVKASMCLELVQSFLLIHDDIIDNDSLRRGGMTLHASYELVGRRFARNPKHFGTSMAICAGDICFAFANEILAASSFPEKNKVRALAYMNHTVHNVIYGQLLDVLAANRQASREEIEKIHLLKTATYTFVGPLALGAILAGASPAKVRSLEHYSIAMGKAFQLQDDILGLFGDEQKLGKPVGSDVREGKATMLVAKALESASQPDRLFISRCLGNASVSAADIARLRSIVESTGSLDYSRQLVLKLASEAKLAARNLNINPKPKAFLIALADYLVNREN